MNQVTRRYEGYIHIDYEPNPPNRLGGVHGHTHTHTQTHTDRLIHTHKEGLRVSII